MSTEMCSNPKMLFRFYSNRFALNANQTTTNELARAILSIVSTGS